MRRRAKQMHAIPRAMSKQHAMTDGTSHARIEGAEEEGETDTSPAAVSAALTAEAVSMARGALTPAPLHGLDTLVLAAPSAVSHALETDATAAYTAARLPASEDVSSTRRPAAEAALTGPPLAVAHSAPSTPTRAATVSMDDAPGPSTAAIAACDRESSRDDGAKSWREMGTR